MEARHSDGSDRGDAIRDRVHVILGYQVYRAEFR